MHGTFCNGTQSVSRERIYIREMKNKRSTTQTVPRIILGQIDFSALPFEHICIQYVYDARDSVCVVCRGWLLPYHTISLFD